METNEFLNILDRAKETFKPEELRLAAEGWERPWQTLISTIMSAQSRDEVTIPIAEDLFEKYPTLEDLASAKYDDVLEVFSSLNYNKTKAKHVIKAADKMVNDFGGKVPNTIKDLLKLPGVGRKTANLVMSEVHRKPAVCVDTHVHRISNVLGFVNTKRPKQTEMALRKKVPEERWSEINPNLVRWGKNVPGEDKERLLSALK